MLQSMTGFGKSEINNDDFSIKVEIKSLNHKNIDVRLKFPERYSSNEILLKNELSKYFLRGKIDCVVKSQNQKTTTSNIIDEKVVGQYFKQLENIANTYKQSIYDIDVFSIIMKMPDVLKQNERQDETEWKNIHKSILEATENLIEFRKQEGKIMQLDIEKRISLIQELLKKIPEFEEQRIEIIQTKLKNALSNFNDIEYDKNRLEQEMIYYIEKFDITEEKIRLQNHCKYFFDTINGEIQCGKKLGFISQEIGREINTIGSKANNYNIQKIVVQMKDELEKVKEQLMNVL